MKRIFFLFFLLLFTSPFSVFAGGYYQPENATLTTGYVSIGNNFGVRFSTSTYSGTVSSLSFKLKNTGSQSDVTFYIRSSPTANGALSEHCISASSALGTSYDQILTLYPYSFSGGPSVPCVLSAGTFYTVFVYQANNGVLEMYGSSASTTPAVTLFGTLTGGNVKPMFDPFVNLQTIDTISDLTSTRITGQSPTAGATTSSPTTFSFSYYNAPGNPYLLAGIQLATYGGTGGNIDTSSYVFAANSGQGFYTTSIGIPSGVPYIWRPYLRLSSTSADYVYGDTYTFFVGNWTASTSFQQIMSSTTFLQSFGVVTNSSTTSGPCTPPTSILDVGGGFMYSICFLFIPSPSTMAQFFSLGDLISTRIPFSYFAQIKDGLNTAYTAVSLPSSHYVSYSPPTKLSTSSPATSTVLTINLDDSRGSYPVVTLLRTIEGYILYAISGMVLLKFILAIL